MNILLIMMYLISGIIYTLIWDHITDETPFNTKGERGAVVMFWLPVFLIWGLFKGLVFVAQFLGMLAEAFAPLKK